MRPTEKEKQTHRNRQEHRNTKELTAIVTHAEM